MSEPRVKRVRRDDGMSVTIHSSPGSEPEIPSRVCVEFSYHFLPCGEEGCDERGMFSRGRSHSLASVVFPAGSVVRFGETPQLSEGPELHVACTRWIERYNCTVRFEMVRAWRYLCLLWTRDHLEFKSALAACKKFGRHYLVAPALTAIDEKYCLCVSGDDDGTFVEVMEDDDDECREMKEPL